MHFISCVQVSLCIPLFAKQLDGMVALGDDGRQICCWPCITYGQCLLLKAYKLILHTVMYLVLAMNKKLLRGTVRVMRHLQRRFGVVKTTQGAKRCRTVKPLLPLQLLQVMHIPSVCMTL